MFHEFWNGDAKQVFEKKNPDSDNNDKKLFFYVKSLYGEQRKGG